MRSPLLVSSPVLTSDSSSSGMLLADMATLCWPLCQSCSHAEPIELDSNPLLSAPVTLRASHSPRPRAF
jgi:hypothetical protein